MAQDKYRKEGAPIYENPMTKVYVYHGRCVATGESVIIKEQLYNSIDQANNSLQEALLQSRLDHPHIAQLYTATVTQRDGLFVFTLVMEYVSNGDLYHEIERRKKGSQYWGEEELLRHLYALVQAFNYAQKRGVAHRDIKPQNIFIAQDGSLKVGDFGSSANTFASLAQNTVLGSPYYLSPELKTEMLQAMGGHSSYNACKSDVFSLAVTVCLMATLTLDMRLPTSHNPAQELERIVGGLSNYPSLQQFLGWMIKERPEERISFDDLEQQLCQRLQSPQLQCCVCSAFVASPEWMQFSQTQQTPLCSQACFERAAQVCDVCTSTFLQTPVWPTELQNYYSLYAQCRFCSPTCIWQLHSQRICAFCNSPLQDSELSLSLTCGHKFHATNCITTFLGQPTEVYCCPLCHVPLTQEDLRSYTGQCDCCNYSQVVVLPIKCRHVNCVFCLTKNNWCCMTCSLPNTL